MNNLFTPSVRPTQYEFNMLRDEVGAQSPHTAHVGSSTSGDDELDTQMGRVLEDGRMLCEAHRFGDAAEAFAHGLAVCEKTSSASECAIAQHNIGYCHHQMSRWAEARTHYEAALALFRSERTPSLERWLGWLYADVTQSRILFVKERLLDVALERLPEREFLDEWGTKRADLARLGPEVGTPSMGLLSRDGSDEAAAASTARVECGAAADSRSEAEMEAARREWLAYNMATGRLAEAAELVVMPEEKEQLENARDDAAWRRLVVG